MARRFEVDRIDLDAYDIEPCEQEEIIRVSFSGNSLYPDDLTNIGKFNNTPCINCPSNPKNGGDGICFCTLGQMNVVY